MAGAPSSSRVKARLAMRRKAAATCPSWRNTFTRNRPAPGTVWERSTSPVAWNPSRCAADMIPTSASSSTGPGMGCS